MDLLLQSAPSFAVPIRFLLGIVAAVVATLVMDQVMTRVEEGETPPYVASGVLTETPPDRAPKKLASVVHYAAGVLTGGLYIWLLYVGEALAGAILGTLLAAIVLYALMVGFFVVVVLPQVRGLHGMRRKQVVIAWATDAAAYVAAIVPLVAIGSFLL